MSEGRATDRTELAEDRTLLASERTFAGWMRTSMGCIGLAIACHALFGRVEPLLLARLTATLFLLLSIAIALAANRRAAVVRGRLSPHVIAASRGVRLGLIAYGVSVGAVLLGFIFWLMPSE